MFVGAEGDLGNINGTVMARKYLEEHQKNKEPNLIANITLIDGYSNKHRIGKKSPSEYIGKFTKSNKEIFGTLQTHLIKDIKHYGVMSDNYDGFIQARSKAIALALNEKMMSMTQVQPIEEENLKSPIKSMDVSARDEAVHFQNVSLNDVKARILRIPNDLRYEIGKNEIVVLCFDGIKRSFNIDKQGIYVGGVTDIFKKYGLLGTGGQFFSRISIWKESKEGFNVKFVDGDQIRQRL